MARFRYQREIRKRKLDEGNERDNIDSPDDLVNRIIEQVHVNIHTHIHTHTFKTHLLTQIESLVDAASLPETLEGKIKSLGLSDEKQSEVQAALKQVKGLRSTKYASVTACIESGSRKYESMVRAIAPIIEHILEMPKFKGQSDVSGILPLVIRKLKLPPCEREKQSLRERLFHKDAFLGKLVESWRAAMREENRELSQQILGIVLEALPKGKSRVKGRVSDWLPQVFSEEKLIQVGDRVRLLKPQDASARRNRFRWSNHVTGVVVPPPRRCL